MSEITYSITNIDAAELNLTKICSSGSDSKNIIKTETQQGYCKVLQNYNFMDDARKLMQYIMLDQDICQ